MKKELTMTMIIMLALVADSLCVRQIYTNTGTAYLKNLIGFLLIAVGAGLFAMGGFFIRRLVVKQA